MTTANEAILKHSRRHRIEWRPDTTYGTTRFWSEQDGWRGRPEDATIYTEAERAQYTLPEHGIWVVLNEEYNPAGSGRSEVVKTGFICGRCGLELYVYIEPDETVYEGCEKIVREHRKWSPACMGDLSTIRLLPKQEVEGAK